MLIGIFYLRQRRKTMKEFAKRFYNSRAWKKCRRAYIDSRIMVDGGMCEICGERVGYIVHHKELLTPTNITDPSITLSFDNLQYVCKPCHDEEEGHLIQRKGCCCGFDAEGQPIDKRKFE